LKGGNIQDASRLYLKGIDVGEACGVSSNELAVLYANKSMCELKMGKAEDALNDATKAISLDPAYVKGYYRKASACLHLKSYDESKKWLLAGLEISPNENELKQLLAKTEELSKAAPTKSVKSSTTSTTTTTSSSSSSSKINKKTEEPSSNKPQDAAEPMDVDDEGVVYRGYKKTADGRVTTFFNNELDDKTKSLIGKNNITMCAIFSLTLTHFMTNKNIHAHSSTLTLTQSISHSLNHSHTH